MTLTQLLTPPCPTSRFKPEGHGESSRRLGQTDKRTASRAAGGTTQHGKSLDTTLVSQKQVQKGGNNEKFGRIRDEML
ncbi:uncharacterized protein LOC143211590 isoform X3 [Lasioglossum baleicum]|uniref:uncharacterized protein LOC143211590 isoform X3 n=1 Tax=Lasioglossum baleicum TaxID=434251 RepID=UPI003FCC8A4B